jgi:multimeric flavodoxin WrbA
MFPIFVVFSINNHIITFLIPTTMKKNILVLTGSFRKNGNSDLMADAFIRGAEENGHHVTKFETAYKSFSVCKACKQCYSNGQACPYDKAFSELAPYVLDADVLVISTPLYWFTFPAPLKAALDKFYSFMIADKSIKMKESVLLACGEGEDISTFSGLTKSYEMMADYCGWINKGSIIATGVGNKGEIVKTGILEKIEQLGRDI